MKKKLLFFLDHGVVNVVTKWKKTFFSWSWRSERSHQMKKNFFFFLDHGVVNAVTKLKKAFLSLDHGVVNVVTKWKFFFSLGHGIRSGQAIRSGFMKNIFRSCLFKEKIHYLIFLVKGEKSSRIMQKQETG